MRFVKLVALLVAMIGGFGLSGGASATPLGSGTLLTRSAQETGTLVETVQFYVDRRRYVRPRTVVRSVYYGPGYYRPRAYYAPAYRRSRVVCRISYGYYGPRRVCVRRYF